MQRQEQRRKAGANKPSVAKPVPTTLPLGKKSLFANAKRVRAKAASDGRQANADSGKRLPSPKFLARSLRIPRLKTETLRVPRLKTRGGNSETRASSVSQHTGSMIQQKGTNFIVSLKKQLQKSEDKWKFRDELNRCLLRRRGAIFTDFDISQNNIPCEELESLLWKIVEAEACIRVFRIFGTSTFDDDCCKAVARWLSEVNSDTMPRELHLSDCAITDEGFRTIIMAIIDNPAFPRSDPQHAGKPPFPTYIRLENNYISESLIRDEVNAGTVMAFRKTGPADVPRGRAKCAIMVGDDGNFLQRRGGPSSAGEHRMASQKRRMPLANPRDGKNSRGPSQKTRGDGKSSASSALPPPPAPPVQDMSMRPWIPPTAPPAYPSHLGYGPPPPQNPQWHAPPYGSHWQSHHQQYQYPQSLGYGPSSHPQPAPTVVQWTAALPPPPPPSSEDPHQDLEPPPGCWGSAPKPSGQAKPSQKSQSEKSDDEVATLLAQVRREMLGDPSNDSQPSEPTRRGRDESVDSRRSRSNPRLVADANGNDSRKDAQEESEHSDRDLIEQQDGQDDFEGDDRDKPAHGAYAGEPNNGETRAEEDMPLPGDWEEHWDEDQAAYYYFNIFSGESSWDHPATLSR